jgi:cytochrome b561
MADPTGPARYHPVARLLHWTMLVAIGAQFLLGYGIDRADDLFEWVVEWRFAGEDDALVFLHVGLGMLILLLATVRLLWRLLAGLPPWAPELSEQERRVAHRVEQVLYAAMFLIPLTGIALVVLAGEDWQFGRWALRAPVELVDDDVLLGVHIATHVAFLAALTVHVGMVLKHQVIDRDRLLRRMW